MNACLMKLAPRRLLGPAPLLPRRRWCGNHDPFVTVARRCLSFSFAGPRKLNEILKLDLLEGKSAAEISDIWYTYHESREHVVGICLSGSDGKKVLSRASKWYDAMQRRCVEPTDAGGWWKYIAHSDISHSAYEWSPDTDRSPCSPFFVQPVFRDDGFFMLVSQFQDPSHFLMAYLEDYKMDPGSASPLVSFSVFNDLADSKDLSLVRCDVLNANLHDSEGLKVVQSVLDNYRSDDGYGLVRTFNERPASFDVDDYIGRMNDRWRQDPPCF